MDAVREACPRIQKALENADEHRRSELRTPNVGSEPDLTP